ncbi:MAG: flagellar basal body-associated FliL family protein [Thermoguttaceae bacterium]
MAAEKTNPDADEATDQPASPEKSRFGFLTKKKAGFWLLILLIGTLVIQGIGFTYYKICAVKNADKLSPEIALGHFIFLGDKNAGSRISKAEFSLYITSIDGMDNLARPWLFSHEYRVREAIETLLRQSHSGDFDDPALNDIKRQVREKIDQLLGSRIIDDVIITNLNITASKKPIADKPPETAASTPWLEKHPGAIAP